MKKQQKNDTKQAATTADAATESTPATESTTADVTTVEETKTEEAKIEVAADNTDIEKNAIEKTDAEKIAETNTQETKNETTQADKPATEKVDAKKVDAKKVDAKKADTKKADTQPKSEIETAETIAQAECSRPGELLKTAREAKGLTQEDVARKLNFLPLYVPALENEKFEPLHSVTFIKGYLRAYARFLEIDADEVLRCFAVHHPHLVKQEVHQPIEVMKPEKNTSSWLFKLLSLVVIIALAGAIIVWWQSRTIETLPNVSNQGIQVDTLDGNTIMAPLKIDETTSVKSVEIEAKKADQLTADEVKALQVTTTDKPQDQSKVIEPATAKPVVIKEEKPVAAVKPPPAAKVPPKYINGDLAAATAGNNSLVALSFTNECWVEVKDNTGRMLHASLMQTNDQVVLEGKPPFQVVFGNGTVAKIFYAGKAFDFKSRIRSNGFASVTVE